MSESDSDSQKLHIIEDEEELEKLKLKLDSALQSSRAQNEAGPSIPSRHIVVEVATSSAYESNESASGTQYRAGSGKTKRKREFVCPVCSRNFTNRKNMNRHRRKLHGEYIGGSESQTPPDEPSESEPAPVPQPSPAIKTKKPRTSPRKQPRTCSECGKVYYDKQVLKKHMDMHDPNRPFPCRHCSFRFVEMKHLRSHEFKEHLPPNRFPCFRCRIHYATDEDLQIHIRARHYKKKFVE